VRVARRLGATRQRLACNVTRAGGAVGVRCWSAQAEDLRMAADCIGSIYGEVDVEEVLDVVFRDFCIGK
jgi:tRNA U34 5-carboxymethylaminomethyl modifying GTPase MnmE/TrmE